MSSQPAAHAIQKRKSESLDSEEEVKRRKMLAASILAAANSGALPRLLAASSVFCLFLLD